MKKLSSGLRKLMMCYERELKCPFKEWVPTISFFFLSTVKTWVKSIWRAQLKNALLTSEVFKA